MLLTHTNMSPLESPLCEKSQSISSPTLNENFSSSRAIKDSDLNSQKKKKSTTKSVKLHKPNTWYVNNQRGFKRGEWKYNLRKCIVFLVMCFPWLLFVPIPVALAAAPDASLGNNMHTLIWQMCRVSEHVQCRQVKLGVFHFFLFFPSGIFEAVKLLRSNLLTRVVRREVFEITSEWGLCSTVVV